MPSSPPSNRGTYSSSGLPSAPPPPTSPLWSPSRAAALPPRCSRAAAFPSPLSSQFSRAAALPSSDAPFSAQFSGVAALGLGTYGAHMFSHKNPAYKEVWHTASLYHLVHTAVLLGAPMVKRPNIFVGLLTAGIVLFSGTYASYEVMGFNPASIAYGDLVERVLSCFGPSEFSVAVTISGGRGHAGTWGKELDVGAFACSNMVEQEMASEGLLIYQSFTATSEVASGSPRSVLHCLVGDYVEDGSKEGKIETLFSREEDAVEENVEKEGKKMRCF